ncbi:MAG: RidA family protein [Acidobacteriota bacterium]|nr:RidA family protein [Blastocatellia bacterium]MDW8412882.1 RidA family protein [Acidobacteriota bacterium]
MKEVILTHSAPRAIGPYSQAVRAGGFIFLSGQIPLDPSTGSLVEGGIDVQAERVLLNIKAILESAGSSLEKVVKTTIYLTDMSDFSEVNMVYERFFPKEPPARSTVAVAGLPKNAKLEIEVIAVS